MNIGDQIRNYTLEEKIGDGGFGDVFRARNNATGLEVAIKCSRPDACESKLVDREQRFMREVSCISKLRHPNIVQLFDYGALPDGTLFLVMEYVCGQNLEVVIKRDAPFSYSYASSIILQILDALDEAHRQGIVHRDLKPANIVLMRQGLRSDFVKLLDFGIAKAFNGSEPDLTRQNFQKGAGFGTPQYMPPEQFYGKKIGPYSDLYAVALVYLELLTGKQIITGTTLSEIIEQQIRCFPNIPHPFCDGPLFDIFQRALAKKIAMRYQTAQEMYEDIDAITRFRSPFLDKYNSFSAKQATVRHEVAAPLAPPQSEKLPPSDDPSEDDFNVHAYEDRTEVSRAQTMIFHDTQPDTDFSPIEIQQRIELGDDSPLDQDHDVMTSAYNAPEFKKPLATTTREKTQTAAKKQFTDSELIELAPTNDMSRVDPALALREAQAISGNKTQPNTKTPEKNQRLDVPQKQPQKPAATEDMLTRVHYADPAFSSKSDSSVPKPSTHKTPIPDSKFDEPDISTLNTMMVESDDLPANPEFSDPNSEDLPPIFHQQRTNFIVNRFQPRARPTHLSNASFMSRLKYRLLMTRAGTAFMNSTFYRVCRHTHHRFSQWMNVLYTDYFPELVTSVCIIIVILTVLFALIIF